MGTSTATWLPELAAMNAARMHTSVLPKPTSPQTIRSMGRCDTHVVDHRFDRGLLIGGFLERELAGELLILVEH